MSLVILGYFSFSLYGVYHDLERSLVERATQTAEIQSRSLASPVWDMNVQGAEHLLRALSLDPDFRGAVIYDEEGKPFAELSSADSSPPLLMVERPILRDEEGGTRVIGRLSLSYSRDSVWRSFVAQSQSALLLYIFLIAMLTAAIMVSLRFITSPLMLLTRAMEEYGRGDVDVEVPLFSSRDEIGTLSRTLHTMKKEIDSFREGLESLVNERTKEVTEAKDIAEQASRVKSEFLANMSHEIRTPIAGMLGMVDLINDTPLSEVQRDYVNSLRFSGESLLAILNDVLDFSKIEAGKMRLSPITVELGELFQKTAGFHLAIAERKDIVLALHMAPEVPTLGVLDPHRLLQVINNLVSNALKFTREGGAVVLQAHYCLERSMLEIAVSDTGIGIEWDKQSAIFESFSQAESSTSRRFGGTGLGLTIASSLVKLMGGEGIRVKSRPCVGSCFSFSIPCAPVVVPPKVEAVSVAELPSLSSSLRILVAEDNAINQKILTTLLKKEGHSFEVAQNGLEVLDLLERGAFDIILMDVQMPQLDGLGATREIRNREAALRKRIPIVAVTANALQGDEELCLSAGMDGYITKPVKRGELAKVLARFSQTES